MALTESQQRVVRLALGQRDTPQKLRFGVLMLRLLSCVYLVNVFNKGQQPLSASRQGGGGAWGNRPFHELPRYCVGVSLPHCPTCSTMMNR